MFHTYVAGEYIMKGSQGESCNGDGESLLSVSECNAAIQTIYPGSRLHDSGGRDYSHNWPKGCFRRCVVYTLQLGWLKSRSKHA